MYEWEEQKLKSISLSIPPLQALTVSKADWQVDIEKPGIYGSSWSVEKKGVKEEVVAGGQHAP